MAGEGVATVLDGSILQTIISNAALGHQRQADAAANVAEQTRLDYLEGKRQVGVRESQAMQEMRVSAIAREVLQSRATRDQPQVNVDASKT